MLVAVLLLSGMNKCACEDLSPATHTHTHTSLREQGGIFLAVFMQKWKSQSDGRRGKDTAGCQEPHLSEQTPLRGASPFGTLSIHLLPEKVPLCENELKASTCAPCCARLTCP